VLFYPFQETMTMKTLPDMVLWALRRSPRRMLRWITSLG
jgi:hypothetical protein